MISATTITNQLMMYNKLNDTIKKVSNGGFENTTENIMYRLRNERIQAQKDRELQGIEHAREKYAEFDSTFHAMSETLRDIREKLIERGDYSKSDAGRETITKELNEMSKVFSNLMNSESSTGGRLFGGFSEIQIGNNMRTLRTMPPEYMAVAGSPVDLMVQGLINEEDPDLDEFDKIVDTVGMRHAEVGARGQVLDSMERFYQSQQITNNEFMEKRYKLEEAIAELNNLTTTYEALSKMNARVSMMSLVNYV